MNGGSAISESTRRRGEEFKARLGASVRDRVEAGNPCESACRPEALSSVRLSWVD
jgi:hypothetical protein